MVRSHGGGASSAVKQGLTPGVGAGIQTDTKACKHGVSTLMSFGHAHLRDSEIT